MIHTVDSGYRYANQIRLFGGLISVAVDFKIETPHDAIRSLEKMLIYTSNSVEGDWTMNNEEILATRRETKWGLYDIEMMFEHAIVHILRHRRKIEKFMASQKLFSISLCVSHLTQSLFIQAFLSTFGGLIILIILNFLRVNGGLRLVRRRWIRARSRPFIFFT